MAPRRTPAAVYRELADAIRARGLAVEVALDHAWIFLRTPGYAPGDHGDAHARHAHLGKWIAAVPAARLLEDAARLLPLVHERRVAMFKLTNIWNYPKRAPELVVYCRERDAAVLAAMRAAGLAPRWKYNRETFAGKV